MTTPYPPWAKWIAQDEDGWICIFEELPYTEEWGYWQRNYGTEISVIVKGTPNPHWRNSLDCLGEDNAEL